MTHSNSRVPGFVHLNMERVQSISARLDQGYVKERVEESTESEKETERIMGRIRGYIFGPGLGGSSTVEGEKSTSESTSNRIEENKALHHYHFTLLEEWLEGYEGEWFHDIDKIDDNISKSTFNNHVSEGDIIRVKSDMQFQDFSSSFEILHGFLDSIDGLDDISNIEDGGASFISEDELEDVEEIRSVGKLIQGFEPIFDMFEGVLPQAYSEMIVGEAPLGENSEFNIWALFQEENLETNPVELIAKYQNDTIPNATIIGRVDTITTESQPDPQEDADLGELLRLLSEMGKEFGFKVSYPDVAVTPIAVYR